jgi:hypothetical protein
MRTKAQTQTQQRSFLRHRLYTTLVFDKDATAAFAERIRMVAPDITKAMARRLALTYTQLLTEDISNLTMELIDRAMVAAMAEIAKGLNFAASRPVPKGLLRLPKPKAKPRAGAKRGRPPRTA